MNKLPADIAQKFDELLIANAIPDKSKSYYRKWLRYYWDFCRKYHHKALDTNSLPLFLKKLQDKNQSAQQRQQAHQAISLFYELKKTFQLIPIDTANIFDDSQVIHGPPMAAEYQSKTAQSQNIATRTDDLQQDNLSSAPGKTLSENTGASWVFVFDQLMNEIKLRHYSPKTLKAYRGWIRQFQAYTKSKDYQQLSQQDEVKTGSSLAMTHK